MIRSAPSVCVLTGAGISAESGVPTFRGAGGLWEGYRATDLATPEAFQRDPKTVWRFYNWRRDLLRGCKPNAGHLALVTLERRPRPRPFFTLITQNVDGLHQRAGSSNVVELHGNVWIDRCSRCERTEEAISKHTEEDPRCSDCGARLRPGVVWFGESLPPDAVEVAHSASEHCDLMLVIGTSAVVYPAAGLPLCVRQRGKKLIEINPESTPITDLCDVVLPGSAAHILPRLIPGE